MPPRDLETTRRKMAKIAAREYNIPISQIETRVDNIFRSSGRFMVEYAKLSGQPSGIYNCRTPFFQIGDDETFFLFKKESLIWIYENLDMELRTANNHCFYLPIAEAERIAYKVYGR